MKKFSTCFNGYSKNEVNSFVNDVTKEYESMLNKLKQSDALVNQLEKKKKKYKDLENTLNRAIRYAEDASNNLKTAARNESNYIIEDARKNASRIVNDALIKAEKVEYEAENLKRKVISYKRRFKEALENQIRDIDELEERIQY